MFASQWGPPGNLLNAAMYYTTPITGVPLLFNLLYFFFNTMVFFSPFLIPHHIIFMFILSDLSSCLNINSMKRDHYQFCLLMYPKYNGHSANICWLWISLIFPPLAPLLNHELFLRQRAFHLWSQIPNTISGTDWAFYECFLNK